MRIVTSISPTNQKNQNYAINSWLNAGFKIHSINHVSEIEKLQLLFPFINFIETNDTGIKLFGRHTVCLNAFVDFVKNNGDALIVNSDIILHNIAIPILNNDKELYLYSRYDVQDANLFNPIKFESGFDAFYLTKCLAELLPKTQLCLGQCHWDFWLPVVMIRAGISLIQDNNVRLYHPVHPVQWDKISFKTSGQIFMEELYYNGDVGAATQMAFDSIRQNIIYR